MKLFDQSMLNLFIQYATNDIKVLSKQWNYQIGNDTEVVGDPYFAHMGGMGKKYLTMWFLLDLLDKHDMVSKVDEFASANQEITLQVLLSKFVETDEGKRILNETQR